MKRSVSMSISPINENDRSGDLPTYKAGRANQHRGITLP